MKDSTDAVEHIQANIFLRSFVSVNTERNRSKNNMLNIAPVRYKINRLPIAILYRIS